mgnify:FL=1
MINTNNLDEARKQIQKLKKEGDEIIVLAQDDNFNRKIFENKDVDLVVGLEFNKKDYLKQRNSGLNEITARLAKKNNIKILVDIEKISKLDRIEKSRVLARVRQNIELCKRVGCKMVILGSASKQDVMSFFLTFKGSTRQAKESFLNN